MSETQNLPVILILLATAVVIVALFRKLKASPVLGYLVAGAIIGPSGIGIIKDIESAKTISEFGVVFMLFIIGLELSWERLITIRKNAFALGFLQVAITSYLGYLILHHFGFGLEAALIIAGGLSLSSTALVMQLIEEYNQKASQLGRLSLAVLLVQDLAVVPLLVLIPVMANNKQSIGVELLNVAANAVLALALILIVGRIILRPIYRIVVSLANPEIFTALTLLVVLGTGWVTYKTGLSLALGAFIAGLLMAETEYRHQVEADVMPFKGLLLGLFFMAVGMSVDLHIVKSKYSLIISLAFLLIAMKSLIIIALSRILNFGMAKSIQAGLLLSQGGEFTFVLFNIAAENKFITHESAQILVVIVTLSMALTPFAAGVGRFIANKIENNRRRKAEDSISEITDVNNHVVILGFGRVGQTVAKLLSAENINYIALDMEIGTVAKARKIGLPVYYGDSSRKEVLHAVGIERASAAIITINEPIAAEYSVRAIRSAMPNIPIIARARDLSVVQKLEAVGANVAVSEMFETSLQLGGALLKSLGIKDQEIMRIIEIFRDRDYALARGTISTN